MEYALAGGSTDGGLIDPLRFDTPPAQNYVIQRRQARWLPTGASSGFSPTGVNQCRITFTGSGWLDLSTLRIQSTLNVNKTSGSLTELDIYVSPALWVDRMRVLSQGTVLEDCHYFNRASTMISRMCPFAFQVDEISQGFSKHFEEADIRTPDSRFALLPTGGNGGGKATGFLTPRALGLVRQGRWWPLSYAPLTLEIWIAPFKDWIKQATFSGCNPTIDNICAHCDIVTLTSELEESWSRYLLSGKVLTFPTTQIIGQYATLPASKDCTISIVRALTRLRCMWVIFNRDSNADPQSFEHPDYRYQELMREKKFVDTDFSAQISVGSRLFPDSPAESWTHMYSLLKQTVGQLDSTLKTMLPMYSFMGAPGCFHSFILGSPFMRCEGYSNGISLRAGDLMTLRLRNIPQTSTLQSNLGGVTGSGAATDSLNTAWLFLYADVIIQVGDGSVVVLD